MSPAADQIAKKRWQQVGTEQVMVAASPYGDVAELEKAADALAPTSAVGGLDCMGYATYRKYSRLPVLRLF